MTLESRIKAVLGEQSFMIAGLQQQLAEALDKLAEAKASQAKALATINELRSNPALIVTLEPPAAV